MLKYLLIFCITIQCLAAERSAVPVFLYDHKKILSVNFEPNPFVKISSAEFKNIIEEVVLKSKIVLIFVEQSFCFEDISLKDKRGTPYFYLSQGIRDHHVKFFPSVMLPYKTLIESFPQLDKSVFYLSNMSSEPNIHDEKLKHYYIFFKDGINESRVNVLKRHDLIMQEIYLSIHKINVGPIFSFYTGKTNPIDLQKLNIVPNDDRKDQGFQEIVLKSYSAMFRLAGLYTSMGHRRSLHGQEPVVTKETWLPNQLSTRFAYLDYEIEFNFNLKKDTWIVDNVALLELGEEVGRTKVEGVAPWNCSYTCGQPLVLVNTRDASSVIISRYQIQPFLHDNILRNSTILREAEKKFGPSVNCAPYFSSQILAGLLVTFFCTAILLYGVISLYNCHTNDKYDNPHGKLLVSELNR